MRHFSRKKLKNVKDDFQLSIMNYALFFGVPAIAVGLSAISLLAMFPSRFSKSDLGTSTGSVTSSPSPKLVPDLLAKDAAPIPNALEATTIELRALSKMLTTHSSMPTA